MKESDVILCGHGSGHPRIIAANKYNSSRYSQTVTKRGKTWHKGAICVLRPKGLTEALRAAYHDKYKTILGRNFYSQSKRGYCYRAYEDGKYYSDCSSSQCLTLKAIGLNMPDYNTEGMYDSDRFERVDVRIERGHIMDPDRLRVGDQILYAGSDPDRAEREYVGHVEGVYSISTSPDDGIVLKYQKFLNDNYGQLLRTYTGELLVLDGEYGYKTRAASVAVWKYMVNKYYEGHLTPGNPSFYGASEKAAEDILNAEVAKHPTFGYILNGVLAGKGYRSTYGGTITSGTTAGIINLQADKRLPQTGRLTAETWFYLFN